MARYCAESDLYDYGLPRGSIPNPGRLVHSVDLTANAVLLGDHGFSTDQPVIFRAEAGGTLPSPLVTGTKYYAIRVDENRFQVSATLAGAALDLDGSAVRVLVIATLPVDASILWACAFIEDMLPAHVVPIDEDAVPQIIRQSAAELAASKLATYGGFSAPTLSAAIDTVTRKLERWAKGVPIRGVNAPKSAGLSARTAAPVDSRGWGQYGGRE